MRKTIMIPVGLIFFSLAGYAQTIDGSIAGRVVDSQGAAITNAAVTVAEPNRNIKIALKSTATGISGAWFAAG